MPLLEITPEMVGPQRSCLALDYIASVMLWPGPEDAEARAEMMRTANAVHLRATVYSVPAANAVLPGVADAMLDALPPRVIVERNATRYYHGVLAGEFLAAAVLDAAAGTRPQLESYKTALANRSGHPRAEISRSTFVNTIWPRFRAAGHLWAAYTYELFHGTRHLAPPCSLERLPEFLAFADFFRRQAMEIKLPQRPRDALLSGRSLWVLPTGLPLPRIELAAI